MYSCTLPMPPSVNGMFAGKARRYKSPVYKAWIEQAMLALKAHPKITERVHIEYAIFFKNRQGGDISNRLKATEDILVRRGIIPDDSHEWIRSFTVWFAGYDKQEPRIVVEIFRA